MHYYRLRILLLVRTLVGLALIAQLIGCSNSSGTSPAGTSPTGNADASNLRINQSQNFDSSPLHIKATAFDCSDIYHNYIYTDSNLVLTDSSLSLDTGSIDQVAKSIDTHDPSLLPRGFTSVPGAIITSNFKGVCDSLWEITNISQYTVQIPQISLRYTTKPQPNTYHYNLLDVCSFPTGICPVGAGGGAIDAFGFDIGKGEVGTVVVGQTNANNQLLTINPGDTVEASLVVSTDLSDTPFIYTLVPLLTLNTSSQQYVMTVSQMTSTLIFTNANHVSCYQLQKGNTLVQIDNANIPFSNDASVYCI